MRVSIVNGSPKIKNSASKTLVSDLERYIGKRVNVTEIGAHSEELADDVANEIANSDTIVFVFPLYVDGIPGHLLSYMIQLEERTKLCSNTQVYAVVNCGFYEGEQADMALNVVRNWCAKAGVTWNGGLGVGGGGALAVMPKLNPEKGPTAPIYKEMRNLVESILTKTSFGENYVSIGMPRYLYKISAQIGWRKMLKANGLKAKDLRRIPD